jgi:hypothetical protein
MRNLVCVLVGVLALAGCGENKPKLDPGRITAIEHVCIIARADLPDRCSCIAKAVAESGDEKLDRMIIARMRNDDGALKRELAGLSQLEANHLMLRYEKVGRDAFYHCGKRQAG